MVKIVGVRFTTAGAIQYFTPKQQEVYAYAQKVVVQTKECQQIAEVAIPLKEVQPEDLPAGIQPIEHIATDAELMQAQQNQVEARAALELAKQKVWQHNVAMKLVKAEYAFDRQKLIFQFTADGRVDFRELVRDLAAVFKTRIELRQIGARDEAKIVGGVGPCGRQLCCSTFLGDFMPVSIKMAKDQNLSLNPTKISGLCGRLMCCLKYENDEYEEAKREMPDYGQFVQTPDGEGRVIGLNLLSRVIKVKLRGQEMALEYENEEVTCV